MPEIPQGRRRGVGTLEALRCSADAVLPDQHSDQPRGERRRRMLRARATRRDSESSLLLKETVRLEHGC
jgi:hypothetical protein